MLAIELYTDPHGEEVLYKQGDKHFTFDEDKTELVLYINEGIKSRYPKAYACLKNKYESSPRFKFLIAKRWAKCNWCSADHINDIEPDGTWNLEKVACPLRGGFCPDEGVICLPKFNTGLSKREEEIISLIEYSVKEIAAKLFISPHTVENHIASIKKKLNASKVNELVTYAHKQNIIN